MASPASGLYRYREITMGSPEASAANALGVDEMNAICFPSGDQVISLPVPGSGLFVPVVGAKEVTSDPSGWATNTPALPPWLPANATSLPSGDHSGEPPESFSPPTRTDFCVA